MDFSSDCPTRLYILKRMTADCLRFANPAEAATNFERPFILRTWLGSARNFGKTRFGRFAIFDFLTPKFFFRIFFFGVKKSKIANRPKRVLPKFRADPSHVRKVRGRLGGIREA